MTTEQRAQRLLQRCFSNEEFEYLQTVPEFVESARHVGTTDDALKAVDIGELLVRQKLKNHNSAFWPSVSIKERA